ncbi:protein unc-93 homolog A-like [Parasteatoda tepidariorum]|uniref:protein unc-93 homolog A-like n=1 Tax=Parasteatoda tepidariorum TaxID=114398 RepID=UPI0039BCF990
MEQSQQAEISKDTDKYVKPDNSNEFTKARTIKNLVLVSFTFLLSFTASEGLATLQSTMNTEVGLICFAVQYACGCIACLFLPKYLIKKFGSKHVLVISMFAYVPYLSSNYYPVFGVMMPVSIIVGFASSLVFNSLCTYVNDLSSLYANLCSGNDPHNLNLENSTEEINILKNNLSDSSQFYDSVRKHKDSISSTMQSLFGENGTVPAGALNTDTEIALLEFAHGSPLNLRASSNDKSQLIEEGFNKQEKKEVWKDKIQTILEDTCGSLRSGTKQTSTTTENLLSTDNRSNCLSNEPGYGRIFESGISRLSLVPEGGTKSEAVAKSELKDLSVLNFHTSDKAIKILETTTSRFFGFFGCVYQASHILCNVISHFIFQRNSMKREYNFNSSCVCGSGFCSMESACILHNLEKPSKETRYILTTVYVVMSFLSALITLLFVDNLNRKSGEVKFTLNMALTTIRFHRNRNLLLLIPIFILAGIIQAFILGDFTKDFIGCAWGIEHVSLVMLSTGCAISLFSGFYGLLEKYVGRYVFTAIFAVLNFSILVKMLNWIPDSNEPTMMFVVAAIWGAAMGIISCQVRAFIGLIFKEEEETGFGCYQLYHALGCVVFYAINNYVCTFVKLYILLLMSTIALTGYLFAERNYGLSKKQYNKSCTLLK